MSERRGDIALEPEIGNFSGLHEIHVTTKSSSTDSEIFRDVCDELGVKAHIIYNETPQGETTVDYLTGSDYECTTTESFVELGRITAGLRSAGLEVVREKIETTPWHPLAPKTDSDPQEPGSYFESHFTLPDLRITHGWKVIKWNDMPLYISTTDRKRAAKLIFATLRHYKSTSEKFCTAIEQAHFALSQTVELEQPTVEFAMYDSNPSHDAAWINSYSSLRSDQ